MEDRVQEAMAAVPRAPFLPSPQRHLAHIDAALPIGWGQTNSQPYTVATMLRLLDVQPGHRVLDLGSGSGWTTALLAHLVGPGGRVLGIERRVELIDPARQAVREVIGPAPQVSIRQAAAGVLGAPGDGPFDRILVSAQADTLPRALVEQLARGGVMVIPVATVMRRLERRPEGLQDTAHGAFRFVPLIEDR